MAKRQKVQRFSIQGWDMRHYRETEAYAQAVQSLYDKATLAITRAAARGKIDPDTPFSFDMYPSVQKEMQRITEQLAERVTVVIESGSKKQWLFACDKNDAFISSIMDTSKVSKARLKKMQDRNLDALAAFQGRKVDGMNLSQRVWKYVGQFKDQLENALDVGLGEGRSADELSRDVRQNLNDPNRLFRRVRDKRGNLVLSKRAAAFHPGRGVYRSSYKNAMRLTRSEINMAYRESDWQRWQSLDFVVGFEIHRSNHEPLCECDICEKLVGRYPKTFKFKGWHPQCMCYATPILMDEETFDENELGDLKAALRGTTYKHQQAKNAVADVPDGFKAWVKDHTEAQKGWASTPYFIKDNFVDGQLGKGLKIAMPTTTPTGKVDFHVPFDKLPVEERIKFNNEMTNRVDDDWDLVQACKLYDVDAAWYDAMVDEVYKERQYWRVSELNAARDRLKTQVMEKIAEAKTKALQAIKDFETAIKDAEEWVGDCTSTLDYVRDFMQKESSEPYPNYKTVLNSANGGSLDASQIRAKVDKAKADYAQAIADANACVAKYGGTEDVAKLKALIAEKRTTARNAVVITKDIQNEISRIEKYANATRVPVPDELKKGNSYMGDDDYEFAPEFFSLLDPLRPVTLKIKKDDSGSYESGGNLVVLANERRKTLSTWERRAVVYHEYGHAIGDQRRIPFGQDAEFTAMRARQISMLKKKTTMMARAREYDWNKRKYVYKDVKARSLVHAIDSRLEALSTRAWGWDDDFCMRHWGVNHHDIIEMVCSTRDTIKALVISYGSGHSTSYFQGYGKQEHEYLAHCFENAFLGNRVFQIYLPDIYNEMIAYIRQLKAAK